MTGDDGSETSWREALRAWLPIVISIVALGVSIASYHSTMQFREEVEEPHVEHQETLDRLDRLDQRIDRMAAQVQAYENDTNGTWDLGRENLTSAESHRQRAELNWTNERYHAANAHIAQANTDLGNVSRALPPGQGGAAAMSWLIVVLIVLSILGVGAYFYSQRGRD